MYGAMERTVLSSLHFHEYDNVMDVTGGGSREVGDMHVAPGYVPVDCSLALTDPDNMMLENFELMEEAKAYRVGDDGRPVRN